MLREKSEKKIHDNNNNNNNESGIAKGMKREKKCNEKN